MTIDGGAADLAWRPVGSRKWLELAADVDLTALASVNSGLFAGVLVGPYAVAGPRR